ncbi:MAG: tRNA lysidine(34) synthetase TilS [Clostridia bacterium]|nr:tRNA lysidine(34) synthetase TilS [Clostridia bacterium]
MKKIEDKILSVIEKHRMLSCGDTVVVAVSGGADSMCLLHFFNKFSSKMQLNIICAHVNHSIRGAEADSDEDFVRKFCAVNNINAVFANYDVPRIAKENGESEEQCGRRLRYEFFSSVSDNAKIATAHNLNDSAETFIFNFTRGTGLKGLTGIPPVRDNIIRPLCECTREEIEQYLSDEGVTYVTDSTNLSDEYTRNKIRHNILPVLNEINPGFFSVFSKCISVLSDSEKYIEEKTAEAFIKTEKNTKFSIDDIILLDKVIRYRLIIKIAEFFGASEVSYRHVEIINSFLLTGGTLMLSDKVTIASDGKFLYKADEKLPEVSIREKYDKSKTEYVFPGGTLTVETVDKNIIKNYNSKQLCLNGFADSNKICESFFRTRKDGDRFRYKNAEHSKSLKNLFREKNISAADRWGIPMLADDEHVFWIDGVGVSAYAAVDEKTENIVKISKKQTVNGIKT